MEFVGRLRERTLNDLSVNNKRSLMNRIDSIEEGKVLTTRGRSTTAPQASIEGTDNFHIPLLETKSVPTRKISNTHIGRLDLTLYNDFAKENKSVLDEYAPKPVKFTNIGHLKCVFQFLTDEQKLLVEVRHIEVNYCPSDLVNGTKWTSMFSLTVELRKNLRYVSRKTSIMEMTQSKTEYILTENHPCEISLKNKAWRSYYLKMNLYDTERKHKDLALGYAHINLSDISTDDIDVVDRIFVPYPEPNSTTQGELVTSLNWHKDIEQLEIKIISAIGLKSLKVGSNTKEYLVKVTVYVGGTENCSYKTNPVSATADLKFQNIFNIRLQKKDMKNMSILYQIYEKQLLAKECVGRALIGPYMKPTLANNTMSCWEKLIISPKEDITHCAILYN